VFLVPVLLGVLAGYMSGGRLRRLARLRLRPLSLIWVPVMISLQPLAPGAQGLLGVVLDPLFIRAWAVGLFVLLNLRAQRADIRLALTLFAVGLLLNATVTIANGGMRVPGDLLAAPASGGLYELLGVHLGEHSPISPLTRFPWCCDVIRIRIGHLIVPLSPGDVGLMAGRPCSSALRCGPAQPPSALRATPVTHATKQHPPRPSPVPGDPRG
jgi:hypothetical protein